MSDASAAEQPTFHGGRGMKSPPSDRIEWLQERRLGIGSSDAAAIAGLDPYRGPLAVWLDKTGRTPIDHEESEYQRWGRLLESAICEEFQQRTDLYIFDRQRMVVDPERDWRRATVDGFVYDRAAGPIARATPIGLIEIKTVAGFKSDAWSPTSENPSGIPEHFQVQVLHQLGVTGLEHAWVAVLFGGQRLEIRELERNDEDLAALLDLEDAFWARVLSGIPPSGDGTAGSTEALRRAYAAGGGEALALPLEAGAILLEREQAKADENAAAARAAAAEQTVMSMLGDAEVGLFDGQRRVTWKRHERSNVDVDALRLANPALVAQHIKRSPYRQLRFVGAADTGGES